MHQAIVRYGAWLFRTMIRLNGSSAAVVVTGPTWSARLARWFVAFAALCLLYQLYAILLVPWIEPASRVAAADPTSPLVTSRASHPELDQLFPEGAWERENPKVLETRRGMLLFRDYQPLADGRLELRPCTVVLRAPAGAGPKGERRPVLLQAPEGAILSFAGALNLVRAEFGRLKSARLMGEITIHSPPTAPDARDEIRVVTRNVQILPRQIWTPHDVTFQYGASRGSGRGLSIALADPDDEPPVAQSPLVSSVHTLELEHVDKFLLAVPAKGLGDAVRPPQPGTSAAAPGAASVPEIQLEITCQGPFQFDFRQGLASLEDHVDIVHVNAEGPVDQLNCAELSIQFESVSGAEEGTAKQAEGASEDGELPRRTIVRRIEAVGFPVVLRAPSVGTKAIGQHLSYDFLTRRVRLDDKQKAVFSYRQHRVEAPALEYELQRDSRRMGKLWASGPGVYEGHYGVQAGQTVKAVWTGNLQLQPQDGLHVLSLVDGADITLGNMGQFGSDELYVWLSEVPAPNVKSPAASGPELAAADSTAEIDEGAEQTGPTDRNRWVIRPVKMLACGRVQADSRQLKGQFNRLEVWFDHPDPAAGRSGAASDHPDTTQPAPANTPLSQPPSPAREIKRLDLSGDVIRLRLLMTKPRPRIQEATVTGSVNFAKQLAVPGLATLKITGEQLRLRTDALDRSEVDVSGTPARVQAQGMFFEGTSLHLSQRENRIWSDGPGRMKLPARARQAGRESLPAGTPVWINWQGGMDFDGQLVRFLRQVEVRGIHSFQRGERLHLRAIGDQLHARLNRYVPLQNTGHSSDLDAVELRFLGDVFVENQTFDLQDALTSHDRMKTSDMTLDRRTGKFHAAGPGWITSVRYDRSLRGQAGMGPGADPLATGQPAHAGPGQLVFLRIDYENAIEGNINTREMEFRNFVRTVYGPISSWNQTLDATSRAGLGPQGIFMSCDRLLLADMGSASQRSWEMTALGDTVVEGQAFTAKADRLSFAQAKDQLVLEGMGRSFAELEYRQPGAPPSRYSARKILYWPRTGQIEVIGGKSAEYSQAGRAPAPRARIR